MADRFPLILNTSANQIQEIASGDQLDLSGNNIANAGIITAGNVTVGAATTDLIVTGDARVTGILTVGTGSLTLNGPSNLVNVGTALTLGHTQGLQFHTQNLHSAGFEVNQINVSGASTIGGNLDANGDLDVDGHTNLDNLSVAGVSTFTGAVTTGDHITLSGVNPRITFTDTNHNPDFELYGSAGNFKIWDSTSNVGRLIVNSDGHVDIPGNLDCGAGIDVTGAITGTSTLTLGNTSLQSGYLINTTGDLYIRDTDGNIFIQAKTDQNSVRCIADGAVILHHSGNAKLTTSSAGIDVTGNITAVDGTFSGNVSIGGTLTYEDVTNIDSVGIVTARDHIKIVTDNKSITFGADDDLSVLHSGSTGVINNVTGDLHIKTTGSGDDIVLISNDDINLKTNAGDNAVNILGGAAVELYHNNTKRFETTSNGVSIPQILQMGTSGSYIDLPDNASVYFGTGDDLRIFHSGTYSMIKQNNGGVGDLYIDAEGSKSVLIRSGDGSSGAEAAIVCNANAATELYHSGTKKFETTVDGITVTGSVTSSAYGSLGNYSGLFGKIRIGADVYGNTIKTAGDANFNITANNSIAFNLGANVNGSDSGASVAVVLSTGIRPTTNGQKDLGEASYRWRNIYTSDLDLSNEGSKNDVDGTWGNYTIQEGESDLFLINKRSGKKYKFNLTEVS